jgi:hypothetical protein
MSRSYRRPWVTDQQCGGAHFSKKYANRKVRRSLNVPNGKAYRKFYNPWNIRDWYYRWTWEDNNEYRPFWRVICK